jgi:carboxylesterase type B
MDSCIVKICQINTVVPTSAGKVKGAIIDNLDVLYYSFKGIPYAEPPVGKRRFQAPVPHSKWNGVRPALEHGNFCANRWGFFGVNNTAGGNEDCLFLNVYTNSLVGPKKSVMFWIHGGKFELPKKS